MQEKKLKNDLISLLLKRFSKLNSNQKELQQTISNYVLNHSMNNYEINNLEKMIINQKQKNQIKCNNSLDQRTVASANHSKKQYHSPVNYVQNYTQKYSNIDPAQDIKSESSINQNLKNDEQKQTSKKLKIDKQQFYHNYPMLKPKNEQQQDIFSMSSSSSKISYYQSKDPKVGEWKHYMDFLHKQNVLKENQEAQEKRQNQIDYQKYLDGQQNIKKQQKDKENQIEAQYVDYWKQQIQDYDNFQDQKNKQKQEKNQSYLNLAHQFDKQQNKRKKIEQKANQLVDQCVLASWEQNRIKEKREAEQEYKDRCNMAQELQYVAGQEREIQNQKNQYENNVEMNDNMIQQNLYDQKINNYIKKSYKNEQKYRNQLNFQRLCEEQQKSLNQIQEKDNQNNYLNYKLDKDQKFYNHRKLQDAKMQNHVLFMLKKKQLQDDKVQKQLVEDDLNLRKSLDLDVNLFNIQEKQRYQVDRNINKNNQTQINKQKQEIDYQKQRIHTSALTRSQLIDQKGHFKKCFKKDPVFKSKMERCTIQK